MSASQATPVVTNAHASATADTKPAVKIAQQLSLTPYQMSGPLYTPTQIKPMDTPDYINLGTAGAQTVKFKIPPGVYNFARSKLTFKLTVADQGANKFVWKNADTLGEIQNVKLKTASGAFLVDIDDYNMVMKVLSTKEYKASKFNSNDNACSLYPSRIAAALNPMPTAALGQKTAFVDQSEKKHLLVSPIGVGAAGTGALVRQVSVYGSDFHDTFLSIDKDLPVGEQLELWVKFMPDKAGWQGTSNVDASTGAAALASGTAANVGGAATNLCVYLENLSFWAMVETRESVVKTITDQFDSTKGLAVWIPWVKTTKQSKQGNQVTFTTQFTNADGQFLKKAMTAVFDNSESLNLMFDHSNLLTTAPTGNDADDAKSLRVTSFRTRLDQKTRQEQDLRPNPVEATDWLITKEVVEGGVIQTKKQFYYGWFFPENFVRESPEDGMQPPEALGGLSLIDKTKTFRNYDFVATMAAGATGNNCWFGVYVTARLVTMWPNKIEFAAQ